MKKYFRLKSILWQKKKYWAEKLESQSISNQISFDSDSQKVFIFQSNNMRREEEKSIDRAFVQTINESFNRKKKLKFIAIEVIWSKKKLGNWEKNVLFHNSTNFSTDIESNKLHPFHVSLCF